MLTSPVDSTFILLRFLTVVMLALITAACAPPAAVRVSPPAADPIVTANQLLNEGNYSAAAAAYAALANSASGDEAARLHALGALAHQDAGEHLEAAALLARAVGDGPSVDPVVAIANACSKLQLGLNEDAFALANAIDTSALTPYQLGRHARCLGGAALSTNRIAIAAAAWTSAYRYPYPLADAPSIAESTWRSVSRLPRQELEARARATPADSVTSGWYALAQIGAEAILDPARFTPLTESWSTQYPQHPATGFIGELYERAEAIAVRPRKLALLLPFSTSLQAAATAIRDGFITAWYLDPNTRARPDLRIYTSTPETVEAVAAQAVAEGAEFIIGPLTKDEVEKLRNATDFATNILALNVSVENAALPRPGFYQFGLTPEDEAAQVTTRAIRRGQRALILAPDTDWGRRLSAAYSTNWTRLGGSVASAVFYRENSEAYVQATKRGLNIDLSEARSAELRRTLNLPIHVEPRSRSDIDLILLAAFPDNARQMLPQLRYFRAESIPVFATSHVYNGDSATADVDLNGITFADMPWLFGAADRDSFNLVRRNWGANVKSLGRFYAFGIDAYRVVPHLARMRLQRNLRIPAVTGNLSMDQFGVVHRDMSWFRYVDGRPSSLDLQTDGTGR